MILLSCATIRRFTCVVVIGNSVPYQYFLSPVTTLINQKRVHAINATVILLDKMNEDKDRAEAAPDSKLGAMLRSGSGGRKGMVGLSTVGRFACLCRVDDCVTGLDLMADFATAIVD